MHQVMNVFAVTLMERLFTVFWSIIMLAHKYYLYIVSELLSETFMLDVLLTFKKMLQLAPEILKKRSHNVCKMIQ